MPDATAFLSVMAALSAAVQQFVEHVVKKRIDWLATKTPHDAGHEARRESTVHLVSFVVGAVLAWSVDLEPLKYLAVNQGPIVNALAAGLMVSFGSSVFNEALGAVREWKSLQEAARRAMRAGGGSPQPGPSH